MSVDQNRIREMMGVTAEDVAKYGGENASAQRTYQATAMNSQRQAEYEKERIREIMGVTAEDVEKYGGALNGEQA